MTWPWNMVRICDFSVQKKQINQLAKKYNFFQFYFSYELKYNP